MSYIGKLENDSILGADENGNVKSLSLGGGLTQAQGSLTAQVDWNTAFDIDMTTAVTCSYTSDGVASMAGLNWDLWNSTNLVSVGIQPGVGMVIGLGTAQSNYPGHGVDISAPVLRLPITGVIPGWDFTQELRLWTQYELTGVVANYQGFRIGIGNNDFGTGDATNRPKLIFQDSRFYLDGTITNYPDKTNYGNSSSGGWYVNFAATSVGISNSQISGSMIHLRQQQQCDWYHFSMAPGETFADAAERMVWTCQGFGYLNSIGYLYGIKPNHGTTGMASGSNQMAILLAPINYAAQAAGHTVTIRRLRLDYR